MLIGSYLEKSTSIDYIGSGLLSIGGKIGASIYTKDLIIQNDVVQN
jgi:hypothetical protein